MRAQGEKLPIVVEAAILIEANWMPLFDEIWLVTAPRDRVIARVERDRGMKPEQTEARIRAQLSDSERMRHAKVVIRNAGTLDELRTEVHRLWRDALRRDRQYPMHLRQCGRRHPWQPLLDPGHKARALLPDEEGRLRLRSKSGGGQLGRRIK